MEHLHRTGTESECLPSTSLIICSRNRPQLLLESVLSVLEGNEVPSELLIMDQSDVVNEALATLGNRVGCDVRYVHTNRRGECPARNQGIGLARHDLFVFTDDDVLVTKDWFGALVRALVVHGQHSVMTGQVRPTEGEVVGGFAPVVKVDETPAVYQGRVAEDVLFPMNMAMYRSALQEVGLFDERLGAGGLFGGAEDNDLGYRLLEAGYQIQYVPQASLYHRAWRSEKDYLPLRWSYGYSQGAFYAKHLSLKDRYILSRMQSDIGSHASRVVRYLFTRSRRQTYADLVYIVGVVGGSTKWLLTQRTKS